MLNFVANVPPYKVYVHKMFLTREIDDYESYYEAYLVSVKSKKGQALEFEVYIPEFGAVYDKIPISKLSTSEEGPLHPLNTTSELQMWDCFSNTIQVVEKSFLSGLPVFCRLGNGETLTGEYKFTIDWIADDVSDLVQFNEHHKSANVCFLDNGQICALPNNRVRFIEPSLTPKGQLPIPPFKVQGQDTKCESDVDFRYGDSNEWSY